jgi:glyoxylase-like metal-dependent hydrolase (beta-lactamase superfamily II)
MIKIKTFIFNPFQENTYLLSDETRECIIIDPGCYDPDEKKILSDYIAENNLKCKMLVNTHCHIDHILGNAYVDSLYKPSIATHTEDAFLLNEANKYAQIFGFTVEQPPKPTIQLQDNAEIKFGESTLKVLHVPGHSPGSVALYSPDQNFVIVGDVLFKGSIGRTDLAKGDYDKLRESIFTKLMTLPPDTIVFPGHGPKTSIHEEALSNPFLA